MKPTVTELLDILHKPALIRWANKIGLQGIPIDQYKKQSIEGGIILHEQIYNKVVNNISFPEAVYNECWDEFIQDKKILFIEEPIETDYFVGRLDAVIEYGGKTYVCDFKSNKSVYLENILQLTAYRMAKKSDFVAVVQIPDFVFKPQYQIHDFTPYENIIKSLSYIWHALKYTGYL